MEDLLPKISFFVLKNDLSCVVKSGLFNYLNEKAEEEKTPPANVDATATADDDSNLCGGFLRPERALSSRRIFIIGACVCVYLWACWLFGDGDDTVVAKAAADIPLPG